MRLFAAVLPPPAVADELAEALVPLHALPGADGLRWTERAGWHLTLAFLGEVEDALLPELAERLGRAAHRTPPFPLRLHRGGRFGRRALWTGAAGGVDELRRLAERAGAAARRAGVDMGGPERFTAHLTLARARADLDLRPYAEALAGFEGTPWQVDRMALVRSHPPAGGVPGERPRYEVADSWPLEGAG
ncbi:RNA 2',3'-cyclic phosphodiesterase [Streptomyces sp. NPDC005805]|uniref:RNA 2',3'-cyclic phosphodiesterase n=1 Tax=Streptomyces sp. NPDC005805 TaxID=3157068 RepID=UPI0033C6F70F